MERRLSVLAFWSLGTLWPTTALAAQEKPPAFKTGVELVTVDARA